MTTKLKTLIEKKYGTVGKMMKENKFKITREHLYRVVNGEINTTLSVISDLADALEVSKDQVFFMLMEAIDARKKGDKDE